MSIFQVLLWSLFGLVLNMAFSGLFAQPDWSLALLLAALLSDRRNWFWVLPSLFFHDLVLYWSPLVTFPFGLIAAIILMYADTRLAPGQQQRWLGLLVVCLPLLNTGISLFSWLLTVSLCIVIWSYLSSKREKVYVEPA
ncbi:MAG: hypothetical protein AUK35_09160 [Zetaproteobacteria bacterium CG2_30_46_52]|nr:MAG: hypothetical protein AUK35_09160 [Zetaproteobacteria bacterium CG2_30_46_52]